MRKCTSEVLGGGYSFGWLKVWVRPLTVYVCLGGKVWIWSRGKVGI